jgi:hypothetical protein
MSNPLPIHQAPAQRGSAPNPIEPATYRGLADLRPHCSRDGVALIDRAYRDAAALHKRVLDLEAELELYRPRTASEVAFPEPANAASAAWPHGGYVTGDELL